MKTAIISSLLWLSTGYGALAEDGPFSTQINITGKENGPYKISATVKPVKRPYKMDPSRNITNDDLSNILKPLIEMSPFPMDRQASHEDIKRHLDEVDKTAGSHSSNLQPSTHSVDPHPHTTAVIQDAVEEIDAEPLETEHLDDAVLDQIDMAVNRARKDLIDAQDSLANAKSERDRQEAISRIENAKERLQKATSAQP